MAAESPHGEQRQSDLAVMDANEYKQKRRLERILDALDNVEDRANMAWDRFVAGEISQEGKNIMIQRTVQQAIREVYNLLRGAEFDPEKGVDQYWAGDEQDPLGYIEQTQGPDIQVTGLADYMWLECFHTETITKTVRRRNKQPTQVTEERQYTVPEQLSWRAFLRLKEFLDEHHDLEIAFEEMDDELPTWGFEEVDEVPEDAEVL